MLAPSPLSACHLPRASPSSLPSHPSDFVDPPTRRPVAPNPRSILPHLQKSSHSPSRRPPPPRRSFNSPPSRPPCTKFNQCANAQVSYDCADFSPWRPPSIFLPAGFLSICLPSLLPPFFFFSHLSRFENRHVPATRRSRKRDRSCLTRCRDFLCPLARIFHLAPTAVRTSRRPLDTLLAVP